jgi:hypothetical protein
MYFVKGILGGLGGVVLACAAFYFWRIGTTYIRFGEVRSWTHITGLNVPGALPVLLLTGFTLGFYLVVR